VKRKITPLTGQVLVEILPADKFSAGGIEIPEHTMSPEENQLAARNPSPPPPVQGIVRAIGAWPKIKNGMALLPEFGIGARVLIRAMSGIEMCRGIGERLKMVRTEDVLAVLS
jgi:co-chaperonin GroES (HSP10)